MHYDMIVQIWKLFRTLFRMPWSRHDYENSNTILEQISNFLNALGHVCVGMCRCVLAFN